MSSDLRKQRDYYEKQMVEANIRVCDLIEENEEVMQRLIGCRANATLLEARIAELESAKRRGAPPHKRRRRHYRV